MNVDNLINDLTQGNSKVSEIQNQLFDVVKVQLHPNMDGFNSPNGYGIYKGSGGDALGVLGKDFIPTQPKFLLDSFVECLIEANVKLDSLSYKTFKGDKKIQFSANLKPIEFKNKAKLNDITKTSLTLTTGFDGYTKTSLSLTSFRLVCLNGMTVKDTAINVAFKNTQNNIGRASSLCLDAAKIIGNMDSIQGRFEAFNALDVKQTNIDAFMLKLLGYNQKDYNEISKQKQTILDNINASVGLEFSRSGSTVWGLLNGITHYTNHVANTKNREDFVYFDRGSKLNTKAQAIAFEMVS